jgi:energy-coupling factor transporter ATP-binding protein EcfA2
VTAGSTAIRFRDFAYRYRAELPAALDAIDLEIKTGEFVGILGPTAAGKSTLLHSVSGAIPHFFHGGILTGSVEVEGKLVADRRLADMSAFVGTLAQDPEAQVFNLFVDDELTWTAQNHHVPADEIRWRVEQVADPFRIAEFGGRLTSSLSGGQKQLLALASIMVANPRVLLLDEPTAELDSAATRDFYGVLVGLKGSATILVAEHKLGLLAAAADQLVFLHEGKVEAKGPPAELLRNARLLEMCGYEVPQIQLFVDSLFKAREMTPAGPILTVPDALAALSSLAARS